MKKKINMKPVKYLLILFVMVFLVSGCTVIFQKGRRSDVERISELSTKIDELSRARDSLARRLKDEIAAKQVSLSMGERGLVVTFVSEVLFDSGKADLKESAKESLNKVIDVIQVEVAGMDVRIEGHTDNVPIKFSGWKTNWELSSARALSVLHYITERGVSPRRLSATGYGEFHPVASNETKEGKQKNRRVEIVIYPPTQKSFEQPKSLIERKESLK